MPRDYPSMTLPASSLLRQSVSYPSESMEGLAPNLPNTFQSELFRNRLRLELLQNLPSPSALPNFISGHLWAQTQHLFQQRPSYLLMQRAPQASINTTLQRPPTQLTNWATNAPNSLAAAPLSSGTREHAFSERPSLTGRRPVTLYLSCDDDCLTRYQCLARKQIEFFEALEQDVEAGTQGRNRSIVLGQLGIRCRHCAHLPIRERAGGSTYYPSKFDGIYQAAQNMSNSHLTRHCKKISEAIRNELIALSNKKSSAGSGKAYWSGGARTLGVFEDRHGLRFEKLR